MTLFLFLSFSKKVLGGSLSMLLLLLLLLLLYRDQTCFSLVSILKAFILLCYTLLACLFSDNFFEIIDYQCNCFPTSSGLMIVFLKCLEYFSEKDLLCSVMYTLFMRLSSSFRPNKKGLFSSKKNPLLFLMAAILLIISLSLMSLQLPKNCKIVKILLNKSMSLNNKLLY